MFRYRRWKFTWDIFLHHTLRLRDLDPSRDTKRRIQAFELSEACPASPTRSKSNKTNDYVRTAPDVSSQELLATVNTKAVALST
ncbi:hypothetical protein DPMN_018412 [Dreissena polymorpha]|uniref:Uncharacterized protein n=1 Tax=Dreissena polymorpha TaxID=45954 RepID=A0A9D4S897_DREPO|nr:hypothetical protein DPMN_018412 [Dreissena polymorpha]